MGGGGGGKGGQRFEGTIGEHRFGNGWDYSFD